MYLAYLILNISFASTEHATYKETRSELEAETRRLAQIKHAVSEAKRKLADLEEKNKKLEYVNNRRI